MNDINDEKQKEEKQEEQEEERKDEAGSNKPRCIANTKKGGQCKRNAVHSYCYCRGHLKLEGDCPICFESDLNYSLDCGHRFHRSCFEGWKQTQKTNEQDITCPMCRTVVKKTRRHKTPTSITLEVELSEQYDVEEVIRVLQEMFPFPAQIIEVMAQELLASLELE